MPKTPEKKVQDKIIAYLKNLSDKGYPIFYERRQAGGFSYKMGLPDIYCVINGYHIEIEVKAKTGSQSSMQEKWEEIFTSKGIPYLLINDVEELKSIINELL